jgi:class 3 adenylate cyclase/pimeloyl-ACP methyl ester carboxylesterase
MGEREVRYCMTEDGVRIAYCVEGDGPGLLIPGGIGSFSLSFANENAQSMDRSLSYGRRVIRFDSRGVGLSEREVSDLSHQAHVRDLEAVLLSLAQPVSVFAGGLVGPAAIECVARHPSLVHKLVLYGACARFSDVFPRALIEGLANMALTNFETAIQMMTLVDAQERRDAPEVENLHVDIVSRSMSPRDLSRYLLDGYDSDATPFLPKISVPTLVLHRLEDPMIPFEEGRKLHMAIPGARLIPLQGASHQEYIGDWRAIVEAVNGFLEDGAGMLHDSSKSESETARDLRTVLFTDLVGHTEMMSRLGDERGRDVLREHERITREVLKANGGTEVKTMGDGFMASFGSVTKAVECAVALQKAIAERNALVGAPLGDGGGAGGAAPNDAATQKATGERNRGVGQGAVRQRADAPTEPLSVRVGLNAGEPIEEDGDLFGATVILASRIAAKAEGGEILVADTVRGLCSGKGFLFADRGEFVAKGFEEPVRVYEVNWRA